MKNWLERNFQRFAYHQTSFFWNLVTLPLMLLYRSASLIKKQYYLLFGSVKIRNPVILVGNVTVGGSGKTPLVQKLIASFSPKWPVVLISRGYGARFSGRLAAYRHGLWDRPGFFGDEVQDTLRLFPEISAGVGKHRAESAMMYEKIDPSSLLIFDDALQYWRMQGDVRILVVQDLLGFGSEKIFPSGPMREPLSEILPRIDLLVLVGGTTCLQKLASKFDPQSIFLAQGQISSFRQAGSNQPVNLATSDQKALLLSSIADPQRFRDSVTGLGISVCEHLILLYIFFLRT